MVSKRKGKGVNQPEQNGNQIKIDYQNNRGSNMFNVSNVSPVWSRNHQEMEQHINMRAS